MPWNPESLPPAAERTFVVTGATAGIGYFASEQLASTGAHVVIAARSAAKAQSARAAIREQHPAASLDSTLMDLSSLASVARAAEELSTLPRIDGIVLNGGAMAFSSSETTADGLPVLLGTHVIANVALIAHLLPTLVASAERHGISPRIVHTSTGYVERFGRPVGDIRRVPRIGIAAYTKAKTVTEIFAFELDRRLRAAGLPVASIVTRPGVGVDAKTPYRAGIRDASTPYQRNPYTPWAQGKDTAAWSAVRAAIDPDARGGDYFAPAGGVKGAPVAVPSPRTAQPGPDVARRVWSQLEELTGTELGI